MFFVNVIRCSTLRLWVGYFTYFKFTPVFLYWIFWFNLHLCSFIEWIFFSSVKEINTLVSKGMTNIYWKVTIEKKWRTQNFDFQSLKSRQDSFCGAPAHAYIIEMLQLKNERSRSKTVCAFSVILILKGIRTFWSQRDRLENGKFHTRFLRDETCGSAHIRISN